MKYVYIAGPLFDDHERQYLEDIALVFENNEFEKFRANFLSKYLD